MSSKAIIQDKTITQGENAMNQETRIQQIFTVRMNDWHASDLNVLNQAIQDGGQIVNNATHHAETYIAYTVLMPASKVNGN